MEKIKKEQLESENCIKFINQVESTEEIKILKTGNDSELSEQNSKLTSKFLTAQLAYIDTDDEEVFINAINKLTNCYENIVFICNDENFTDEEISNYSRKIDKVIRQDYSLCSLGIPPKNILSAIINNINNDKGWVIGKEMNLWANSEENYERFYSFDNKFIKVRYKPKKNHYQNYYKILSNYTFCITKINVYVNSNGDEESHLEMEVRNDSNSTVKINIPAKDKNSLASFKKILYPRGNFIDFFSNSDFLKIMSQLYIINNPEIVRIYTRPGLAVDTNTWLWTDEVMNLED